MINKRTVVKNGIKEDTYYTKDINIIIEYDEKYPTIVKSADIKTRDIDQSINPTSYTAISIMEFEKALKEALNFILFKSNVDFRIKSFSKKHSTKEEIED